LQALRVKMATSSVQRDKATQAGCQQRARRGGGGDKRAAVRVHADLCVHAVDTSIDAEGAFGAVLWALRFVWAAR
jgi:hypothetical protein